MNEGTEHSPGNYPPRFSGFPSTASSLSVTRAGWYSRPRAYRKVPGWDFTLELVTLPIPVLLGMEEGLFPSSSRTQIPPPKYMPQGLWCLKLCLSSLSNKGDNSRSYFLQLL